MPLQREFAGLADLVGQYTGGRIPLELDQAIKAQIDALVFANRPKLAYQSTVVAAVDATASLPTVPSGKVWMCRAIGFRYVNPGGVTSIPEIVYEAPDNNFYGIIPLFRPFSAIAANNPAHIGWVFDNPFWMEPNSNFAMKLATYSGAAGITVNGFMQYHEIEI